MDQSTAVRIVDLYLRIQAIDALRIKPADVQEDSLPIPKLFDAFAMARADAIARLREIVETA
jgi:hypothetical protein